MCIVQGHSTVPPVSPEQTTSRSQIKKEAKIRNRYNQAQHLTQETNGKVTTLQLDITNESLEVSPFPTGDHKASINRRAQQIQDMNNINDP